MNGAVFHGFVPNVRTRACGLDAKANKSMNAISSEVFWKDHVGVL